MKLKCGGMTRKEGYISIDKFQTPNVDKIADFDKFSYPFERSVKGYLSDKSEIIARKIFWSKLALIKIKKSANIIPNYLAATSLVLMTRGD